MSDLQEFLDQVPVETKTWSAPKLFLTVKKMSCPKKAVDGSLEHKDVICLVSASNAGDGLKDGKYKKGGKHEQRFNGTSKRV